MNAVPGDAALLAVTVRRVYTDTHGTEWATVEIEGHHFLAAVETEQLTAVTE